MLNQFIVSKRNEAGQRARFFHAPSNRCAPRAFVAKRQKTPNLCTYAKKRMIVKQTLGSEWNIL
jgi:hypothetical protein